MLQKIGARALAHQCRTKMDWKPAIGSRVVSYLYILHGCDCMEKNNQCRSIHYEVHKLLQFHFLVLDFWTIYSAPLYCRKSSSSRICSAFGFIFFSGTRSHTSRLLNALHCSDQQLGHCLFYAHTPLFQNIFGFQPSVKSPGFEST